VLEWLFWQVGGWADGRPEHHFGRYAPQKIPYAIDRYVKETTGSMAFSTASAREPFLAGEYSIAAWPPTLDRAA